MRFFHLCFILILISISFTSLTIAEDQNKDEITGLWITQDASAVLQIVNVNSHLIVDILAIRDSEFTSADEDQIHNQPRLDIYNPEETLRSRFLVGLRIGEDFIYENGYWNGKIYDPTSGNIYRCKIKLIPDGLLRVKAYVGIPLLGRTTYFFPAEEFINRFNLMIQSLCNSKLNQEAYHECI